MVPPISSSTHHDSQEQPSHSSPLSHQSQVKITQDKEAEDQTRNTTNIDQQLQTQRRELHMGPDKFKFNQVHKTNLSEIKEESEPCETPAHKENAVVGSTVDGMSSEIQLSEPHLDPTGGALHYNSVNSFSSSGPSGSVSGQLPITSVTVTERSVGKRQAIVPNESKNKQRSVVS